MFWGFSQRVTRRFLGCIRFGASCGAYVPIYFLTLRLWRVLTCLVLTLLVGLMLARLLVLIILTTLVGGLVFVFVVLLFSTIWVWILLILVLLVVLVVGLCLILTGVLRRVDIFGLGRLFLLLTLVSGGVELTFRFSSLSCLYVYCVCYRFGCYALCVCSWELLGTMGAWGVEQLHTGANNGYL